ncbi:MAG: ABC transporter substrate-binding protein [Candidatus Diapherotrites archaeon]|nr:ABC transporter substrate-binding protein [Candidatus Diapherotrites archaeon]
MIFKEAFLNDFKKRGGKVDLEVSYNQGDADFRSEISLLQNSDSNSIILISLQKETPLILKQMDEIGFDKNIFTDVYAAELKENLGLKTVKLIEYLKPAIDFAKPNSAAEKFAVNFNIAYGIAPDFISAQAYDGAKMLFLAMKSCQDIDDSNCVKDELYKIRNYSGAIGDGVSFDINGDIIGRKIVAMRIIDGKFVEAN